MPDSRDKGRLQIVDAIRALALFGVLVMNLRDMSGLNFLTAEALAALQGPVDEAVDFLLHVVFDEKFLSSFSFLFGLSFYLLLERKSDQPGFMAMYFRRLLVLAGFGLINIAFLYWGDILLVYAVFGTTLVLMVRLPQWLLLTISALLLFGAPVALALIGAVRGDATQTPSELDALRTFSDPAYWPDIIQGLSLYFGLGTSGNLIELWDHTNVYGMLLLGLWTGRAQIPHRVDENRTLLRSVASICLPVGLLLTLLWVVMPSNDPVTTVMRIGAPVLAVGYMSLGALLLDRPGARNIRAWLASSGRLALTNYLVYGLVGQVLLYGWGLGWIGNLGSAEILLLAMSIYAVALVLSRLWLIPFRMGPTEWVWRCLTYLRLSPLRRQ
ncbi:DUF418 domain-containing protein [Halomonas sp. McH1-25]|uniref:DUF418 domain-containing protein n=1 Tax=unclassified Halomonas TaxID=2609666 RepID=UPI001EF3E9BC|nr:MULTISPECIES: DUF418 domain-containing protein [unclassified Halomonas]MCG7600199.1 DUF418 domain-containing protein [Halomonas sp. McH1-25]MCP1341448.1 DUF418 domain-containing protein [Halomonas sp. FL8]MCP1360519.1 DUF418 domain-containing protein [Halomonas sp. BBD45]MCP1364034.1 DUF418 domain-containing protein [Halomonas sp. BBD48]